MNKMLCILMAVLALSAVINCKVGVEDGTTQHDLCSIVGCVNDQEIIRKKRANGRAVAILGGIDSLITNILKTTFDGIEKAKKAGRKKTMVVGPGKNNKNTVIINPSRG